MKKHLREILLALTLLAANAVLAAPEDRFKGGKYDGYANYSVVDTPMPVSSPRIKINGVPYDQIKSINDSAPRMIINGVRY